MSAVEHDLVDLPVYADSCLSCYCTSLDDRTSSDETCLRHTPTERLAKEGVVNDKQGRYRGCCAGRCHPCSRNRWRDSHAKDERKKAHAATNHTAGQHAGARRGSSGCQRAPQGPEDDWAEVALVVSLKALARLKYDSI